MLMRPLSGASCPESIFTTVLLPAPLWPHRAWISPAPTVKDTSCTAGTPPKLRVSPVTLTWGRAGAPAAALVTSLMRGCTARRTARRWQR